MYPEYIVKADRYQDFKRIDDISGSWCYGTLGCLIGQIPLLTPSSLFERSFRLFSMWPQLFQNSQIMCHGLSGLLYYSVFLQLQWTSIDAERESSLEQFEFEILNNLALRASTGKQDLPFWDFRNNEYNYDFGLLTGTLGVHLSLNAVLAHRRMSQDWIFGYPVLG